MRAGEGSFFGGIVPEANLGSLALSPFPAFPRARGKEFERGKEKVCGGGSGILLHRVGMTANHAGQGYALPRPAHLTGVPLDTTIEQLF